MDWTDYELETRHNYIQQLFPSNLSSRKLKEYKHNEQLRKRVIGATIRMLLFFGFSIDVDNWSVKQVKNLHRSENGHTIGLYSPRNYPRLTNIMRFLVEIGMNELSALVFLALCHAMQDDLQFRKMIKKMGYLSTWMNTQPYLRKYRDRYDINEMQLKDDTSSTSSTTSSTSSTSSEKEDVEFGGWVVDSDSSDEDSPFQQACAGFRGLDYTGNSCYQDSVLLALFAISNEVITREILKKDTRKISTSAKKWIQCADDERIDYKRRHAIQNELIRITASLRGLEQTRYCSNLRRLIQRCPGQQEFHGTGTQDAGEFMLYLFNLFQVNTIVKKRVTMVTNSLVDPPENTLTVNDTVDVSTPLINIHPRSLVGTSSVNVRQFIEHIDDAIFSDDNLYTEHTTGNLYRRRIETDVIVSASYIVFNAQRVYYDHVHNHQKRATTRVDCPETIQVGDRKLSLHAIITHIPAHYTCYIRCERRWFWYDDNPGGHSHKIKHIGSYEKMLRHNPDPRRNGTLFFYV